MTKSFRPRIVLVLLLVLALGLAGCVKPRPTPTPMPTKVAVRPSATAAAAPAVTATPTATPSPTTEPTVEATPTEEPTSAPTVPASGEITYEVRWGDTLSRIAREYSTTVEAIMARNPRIANASQVYAGMVLIIPVGATAPATGTATPGTYIVQRGDTLSSIARRFGTTVQALLAANPTITDKNMLYAGQRLVIPGSSSTAPSGQRTHTVQPGDTLSSIARLYGTTVMAIVQRNNLPNPNAIFVGQVLIIP